MKEKKEEMSIAIENEKKGEQLRGIETAGIIGTQNNAITGNVVYFACVSVLISSICRYIVLLLHSHNQRKIIGIKGRRIKNSRPSGKKRSKKK